MMKAFHTHSQHRRESLVFIMPSVMQHNENNLPQVLLNIQALQFTLFYSFEFTLDWLKEEKKYLTVLIINEMA